MLRGYTPRIEPDESLRKACCADEEEFVTVSQARRLLCNCGNDDPMPGQVWSQVNSDPAFLLTLQKVKPDEWMNDENRFFWEYQHVGSEEPN